MNDDIVFKVVLQSDVAEKSIGELKQDFKDLTKQLGETKIGTEEYRKTLASLGNVKGALIELRTQIKALDPEAKFRAIAGIGSSIASGFAAAQGAAALFGTQSEDLLKVLVKVQAATALAQGIQGVTQLGKEFQVLALIIEANPLMALATVVLAVAAAVYALTGNVKEESEEFKKATKDIDAWGKSHENARNEIEKLQQDLLKEKGLITDYSATKRKLQLDTNDQIAKLNDEYREKEKNLNDKTNKDYIKDELERQVALNNLHIVYSQAYDDIIEQGNKKQDVERQKALNTDLADREKHFDELEKQQEEHNKKVAEIAKKKKEEDDRLLLQSIHAQTAANAEEIKDQQQKLKDKAEAERTQADEIVAMNQANDDLTKKVLHDDLQRTQDVNLTKIALAAQTFGAIGQLSMAFAGQNEKGAKRAFEINKAASIAQAIIATYQGANAIFANAALNPSTVLFPAQPFITAGLAIVAGLANVANIAKTQFNSGGYAGGAPGGATFEGPRLGSPQAQENTFQQSQATKVNRDKNDDFVSFDKTPAPVRAYVVETEISSVQKNINRIESNAKY